MLNSMYQLIVFIVFAISAILSFECLTKAPKSKNKNSKIAFVFIGCICGNIALEAFSRMVAPQIPFLHIFFKFVQILFGIAGAIMTLIPLFFIKKKEVVT